jgi:L-threonylcarbamoyladenylate synthase
LARSRAKKPAAFRAAIQGLGDALEALRAGELVVYPTETFYALGADALSKAALARLFAAKGREPGQPVALIAADIAMAFAFAREIPPVARRLADMFWPGALTLVVPARDDLPAELVGAGGGVGVRVSPHPIAHALAAELGRPITATSANLADGAPARTLAEARGALGEKVNVYLEGGTAPGGAPSTVVAVRNSEWSVLREGAVTARELTAALAEGTLK